ncbi:hypothetical protein [Companilactobacillus suantsaicola]|uniref:hypothetical protein n=1 Tax=Companilactobacillus suantsaicola TaxID=2487723 RepID=UPI00143680FF|nr:hypothetical protein [Companilactobacillus suantsaicola]
MVNEKGNSIVLNEEQYDRIIKWISEPVSPERKKQLIASAKRIKENAPEIDTSEAYK